MEEATFGAGCFWCVEAVFDSIKGVERVVSGFSGGHIKNPAYREVCNGVTGHAEVVRVAFDPEVISFKDLLEVFFRMHNPTTLNKQGADLGTQYRSVIFYHDDRQKELAIKAIEAADNSGIWKDPIVTSVDPLTNFYLADDHHQDYFEHNQDQPYCEAVIRPKMDKFKAEFKNLIKDKQGQGH